MKIYIKLIILLVSVLALTASPPQVTRNIWNGVYTDKILIQQYEKEEREYYAKETETQKKLRKRNDIFCTEFAKSQSGWSGKQYKQCMTDRCSPVFSG